MEELLHRLISIPILFEVVAALAATTLYINHRKIRTKALKFLSIYLWIVIFVEFFGSYAFFVCLYKLDENSFFVNYQGLTKNYWMFNIYLASAYTFYAWYFVKQLVSEKKKIIAKYAIIIFNMIVIADFIFSDIFFEEYSQLMNLLGLILIVLVLSMYYYELLNSDRILSISNALPFYISIGVLIFYVSVTPLMLSSQFFISEETVFVEYYGMILSYANYFLYGMIIFGIVKCYWFNKSQNTKLSSSPTLS